MKETVECTFDVFWDDSKNRLYEIVYVYTKYPSGGWTWDGCASFLEFAEKYPLSKYNWNWFESE